MTEPDPALVAALADAVRSAVTGRDGTQAHGQDVAAEWSQAGTEHSGRIHTATGRYPLTDACIALFAQLRHQMRSPERGTWLSARLELPAGAAVQFIPNQDRRPWWNSTTRSMLTPDATTTAAQPTDDQWRKDLAQYPRAREYWPGWLISTASAPVEEFPRLRAALDQAGFARAAVLLPGEDHPLFEGAIVVRPVGTSVFTVLVTDYGQTAHVGDGTAQEACRLVWTYLTSPLPAPVTLTAAAAAQRAQASAPPLAALAARVGNVGLGGIATTLAPGVLFDRIGGLDGLYFFCWQAPVAHRSLPPTATGDGAQRVVLLAHRPVRVQVEFAPAWFNQPGGALRLRALDERLTIRGLIHQGALSVVHIPDAPRTWA